MAVHSPPPAPGTTPSSGGRGAGRQPGRAAAATARAHDACTAVLGLLLVPDPRGGARRRRDHEQYVRHQQRVDAVMRRLAPVVFLSTAVSGAAAALALAATRPRAAALRAAASALVVAAVVHTVRVNAPINERLRLRSPEAESPGWREDRDAWEAAHRLRRVLVAGSVALAAAGGVAGRGR